MREMTGERAAAAFCAVDLEPPAMPMQRVFDDCEPQSRAAGLARAARIDAVEALGQTRQMLGGNARAGVAYGEMAARLVRPPADLHGAVWRRVLGGVVHEVRERGLHHGFVADETRRRFDCDLHLSRMRRTREHVF